MVTSNTCALLTFLLLLAVLLGAAAESGYGEEQQQQQQEEEEEEWCRCSCVLHPLPPGVPLWQLVREAAGASCPCPPACSGRTTAKHHFAPSKMHPLMAGNHRLFAGSGNCHEKRCSVGRCLVAGGGCNSWRPFTLFQSDHHHVSMKFSMRYCEQSWNVNASHHSYVLQPAGASSTARDAVWLLPVNQDSPGMYSESNSGCFFDLHSSPSKRNIIILAIVGGALGIYYLAFVVHFVVYARRDPKGGRSWRSPYQHSHHRCAPILLVVAYLVIIIAMSLCVAISLQEGHNITTISSSGQYYPEHLIFCAGYSLLAPLMWFVIATYASRENAAALFVLSLLHIPFLVTMAWTDGINSHGIHISGAIVAIGLLHICCIIHTVMEFRKGGRSKILLAWYVITSVVIPPFVVMWFTVSKVFEWLAVASLMLHYAPWTVLMFQWKPLTQVDHEDIGDTSEEEAKALL